MNFKYVHENNPNNIICQIDIDNNNLKMMMVSWSIEEILIFFNILVNGISSVSNEIPGRNSTLVNDRLRR
jgi:hypothetical protein